MPHKRAIKLPWRRGSAGFVTITSSLAVLLVGTALVLGSPATSGLVDILSGRAWLSDDESGTVMLANGSSAELELRIKVPGAAGKDLEVIQVGGQSLLVDGTGRIVSLDLDTLDVGNERRVGDGVDLLAIDDLLLLVNRETGRVQVQEPLTGDPVASLELETSLSRAVLDEDGLIWLLDLDGGTALALEFDGERLRRKDEVDLGISEQSQLTAADGDPTVIDAGHNELIRVPDGDAEPPVKLGLRNGEVPAIPRVIHGDLIPIAANTKGYLILVDGDRASRIALRRTEGTLGLGEPIPFDGRVYVPDFDSGRVIVLDANGNEQPGGPEGPRGRFSVRVEGGRLWVDYPGGDSAWVLDRGDRRFREVDKRREDVPSNDTDVPEEETPAPLPPPPAPKPSGGQAPTVAPSPPGSAAPLTAAAGNKSVLLAWSPAAPNGAQIEQYDISWSATGGGSSGSSMVGGEELSTDIVGLRNGASYTFTIRARNSAGDGPPAQSPTVVPDGEVPEAPPGVSAAATPNGTIDVSWGPADPNGASPVAGYIVTATDGGGNAIAREVPVSPQQVVLTIPDDGLIEGADYQVTVRATNAKDKTGPESDPASAGTVWLPADAPTIVSTTGQDGGVHVDWDDLTASALHGGQLVGYRVTGPSSSELIAGGATEATVPGTNGQLLQVTVAPVTTANGDEQDGASAQGSATPGRAPVVGSANVSASGTTVNWSFSMSDVGDPVGTCRVTRSSDGATLFNAACPGSGSGAFDGGYSSTYSITVTATGQNGTSTLPSGTTRTADPPTRTDRIADAILGGTWARDGSHHGGTWGTSLSRPAGGVRWITNNTTVTINCTRRDAGYTVQFRLPGGGSRTETWYWWVRLTDGTWVRSAALNSQMTDGPFPGVIQC